MKILSFNPAVTYNSTILNKIYRPEVNSLSFDTVSFGANLSDKVKIIPALNPTSLELGVERKLGIAPLKTEIETFKNGETYINIDEKVRGKMYILCPQVLRILTTGLWKHI